MSDPRLGVFQCLPGCSRCIDDSLIDRADIIFLLQSGNLRRSVGRIVLPAADTAQPGRKVRHEKETDKPLIRPRV
jgi:hypothetical protein